MKLILENGSIYQLNNLTNKEVIGNIIVNTSVVGYQELISNPIYLDSILVLTYPLIGNYGLTDEDYESKYITIKSLIVSELNDNPSNFRYTKTLNEVLDENDIKAYEYVDVRKLVREVKKEHISKAMIALDDRDTDECLALIKEYKPSNLVEKVSVKKICYARTRNPLFNVVVFDFGVTRSLINHLNSLGCNVIIVPYNTKKEDVLKHHPDAVILSSGPEVLTDIYFNFNDYDLPILGLGIGALKIALNLGAQIIKLSNNHYGANHPIKDLVNNTIDFYEQHHSYTINDLNNIDIRYVNVIDNSVEGFKVKDKNIYGAFFMPYNHKGPKNKDNLITEFIKVVSEVKKNA